MRPLAVRKTVSGRHRPIPQLATSGIPLMTVLKAVQNANVDVGAKVIENGGMELIVRGVGILKNQQDIENIAVGTVNGTPILNKIAHITTGPDFRRGILDKAGNETVGGIVLVR